MNLKFWSLKWTRRNSSMSFSLFPLSFLLTSKTQGSLILKLDWKRKLWGKDKWKRSDYKNWAGIFPKLHLVWVLKVESTKKEYQMQRAGPPLHHSLNRLTTVLMCVLATCFFMPKTDLLISFLSAHRSIV